jgi:hypothetical protein
MREAAAEYDTFHIPKQLRDLRLRKPDIPLGRVNLRLRPAFIVA